MEGSLPIQGDPRRKGVTRRRHGVVVDHAAEDSQRPRQRSCSPHYFQKSSSTNRVTRYHDDNNSPAQRRRSCSPHYMSAGRLTNSQDRDGSQLPPPPPPSIHSTPPSVTSRKGSVTYSPDIPASPMSAAPRIVLTRKVGIPKAPSSAPAGGEGHKRQRGSLSIGKQLSSLPTLALNDEDESIENRSSSGLSRDSKRLGRSMSANSISSKKSTSSKKSPDNKKSKVKRKKSLDPDDVMYFSTSPSTSNSKKSLVHQDLVEKENQNDEEVATTPTKSPKQKVKKKKSLDPSDPLTPKGSKKKKSIEPGDAMTTPKGAKKKKSLEPGDATRDTATKGAKKKKSLEPKDERTTPKGARKKKSLEPKDEMKSKGIKKKKSLEPATTNESPITPLSTSPGKKKKSVGSLGLNLEAPCMYMNVGVDAILSPRVPTRGKAFDQAQRRWVTSSSSIGEDEFDQVPIAPRKARSIPRASAGPLTTSSIAKGGKKKSKNVEDESDEVPVVPTRKPRCVPRASEGPLTISTNSNGKKKKARSATTVPPSFNGSDSTIQSLPACSTSPTDKKKKSSSTTALPTRFNGVAVTMPECPSSAPYSYKKCSRKFKKKSIAPTDGPSPSSTKKKKKNSVVPPPPPLDDITSDIPKRSRSNSWHPARSEVIPSATPVTKKKKKKKGTFDTLTSSWHSTSRIVVNWDPIESNDDDVVDGHSSMSAIPTGRNKRNNIDWDVPCMTMNVMKDCDDSTHGPRKYNQRTSSIASPSPQLDTLKPMRRKASKQDEDSDDDGSLGDFLSPALFRDADESADNAIDDDAGEDLFESLHNSAPCILDLSWMKEGDPLPEPSRSSRKGRSIFVEVSPRKDGEDQDVQPSSKQDPPGQHIQDKPDEVEEFPDLPTETEFNDLDPFLDEEEASIKHRARCDSFDDDDDLMPGKQYVFKNYGENSEDSFSSLSAVPTVVSTSSMFSDLSSVAMGGTSHAAKRSGHFHQDEVNWSSFNGKEGEENLVTSAAAASRRRESCSSAANEQNACSSRDNKQLNKRRQRLKKAAGRSAPNLNVGDKKDEKLNQLVASRTQKSERTVTKKSNKTSVSSKHLKNAIVDAQDSNEDGKSVNSTLEARHKKGLGFSSVKDAFLSLSPKFTPKLKKHSKRSKNSLEEMKNRPLSLAKASAINSGEKHASLVVPKSTFPMKLQKQGSSGRHLGRKSSIGSVTGSVTSATTATSATSSMSWPSPLPMIKSAAVIAMSPKRK